MAKEKTQNEKLEMYIKENLIDDVDLNLLIGDVAGKLAFDKFNIKFTSPELVLGFYGVAFNTIMEVLLSKRSDNSEYKINIADVIEIGYTNFGDDDESEKIGGFCPYIYNLDNKKKDYSEVDITATSVDRCVQWNSKNIREQIELIKEISTLAVKNLHDEIAVPVGNNEVIFPLFILIHEQMISTLTLTMIDQNEQEMDFNFISCYDVKVRKEEDGKYTFGYKPNVTMKGSVKSDAINSKNMEE